MRGGGSESYNAPANDKVELERRAYNEAEFKRMDGTAARAAVQLEQRASSRSLVESYRTSRRASGDPCDSLCMAWMWVWWVCWCSPLCTLHACTLYVKSAECAPPPTPSTPPQAGAGARPPLNPTPSRSRCPALTASTILTCVVALLAGPCPADQARRYTASPRRPRSSLHAELWGERRATSAQLCGSSAELCGALRGRCAQS